MYQSKCFVINLQVQRGKEGDPKDVAFSYILKMVEKNIMVNYSPWLL